MIDAVEDEVGAAELLGVFELGQLERLEVVVFMASGPGRGATA